MLFIFIRYTFRYTRRFIYGIFRRKTMFEGHKLRHHRACSASHYNGSCPCDKNSRQTEMHLNCSHVEISQHGNILNLNIKYLLRRSQNSLSLVWENFISSNCDINMRIGDNQSTFPVAIQLDAKLYSCSQCFLESALRLTK